MLPVETSAVTCPHLDYRAASGEREFETERAYCTVVDEFVQPMRADVCNDRYDLQHNAHCEIYLEHAADSDADADAGLNEDGDADAEVEEDADASSTADDSEGSR